MKCQECGKDRPLTYRSKKLKIASVCAPCIRKNHPETLTKGEGCRPSLRVWR